MSSEEVTLRMHAKYIGLLKGCLAASRATPAPPGSQGMTLTGDADGVSIVLQPGCLPVKPSSQVHDRGSWPFGDQRIKPRSQAVCCLQVLQLAMGSGFKAATAVWRARRHVRTKHAAWQPRDGDFVKAAPGTFSKCVPVNMRRMFCAVTTTRIRRVYHLDTLVDVLR